MKTSSTIILFLITLLNPILCQSQPVSGDRVAVYVDVSGSSYYVSGVDKIIRGAFQNILDSNGLEVVPDSTASRIAHDYRKSNAIRTGTTQEVQKKTTTLYYFTIDKISDNVQLSVSVVNNELRKETQNKRNSIAWEFFSRHTSECSELLSYRVAESLGLVNTRDLKHALDSLNRWESETKREEQGFRDAENNKYTALSFLPPVNQFRSGTRQGKNNGWAIITGYTVSIIGFSVSTHYYNKNKRNFEGVTVDLSEAEKARNYYRSKMDLYCGGQIVSGVLFFGTYIYGVANALANRGTYMGITKDTSMKIAPVAYDNGGGIALVYRF